MTIALERVTLAASLMHEACDMLQGTLASASAMEARAVLALMARLRPVADDAEQLAADIAADAEDSEAAATEGADKAARRAGA